MSAVETPPPAPPTGRQCPRCGAPMTEEQEWCLHCGAAVGTRVVAAPGWRTPIAIAAALVAIAAVAVIVAIVQLADDTGQVAQNPPAAAVQATPTPLPGTTPAPNPALTPTPPAATTPTPTPSPATTPTPTPTPSTSGSASARWPPAKSGWTVVLSSDTSRSTAQSKADRFASDGIADVGILKSDDFSSLNPGFWVVFSGQYDSQSAASDALDGIDAKDAYIRRIEPS